jgi:hypothetical protein
MSSIAGNVNPSFGSIIQLSIRQRAEGQSAMTRTEKIRKDESWVAFTLPAPGANKLRPRMSPRSNPVLRITKMLLVGCGSVLLVCGGLHGQQKPTIEVSSASYGLNVSKHAQGNATKYVKSACNAKRSCNFAVKDAASRIAGLASTKFNDFEFVYRCGDKVKKGHVDGNSTNKIILLTCAD